MNYSVLFTKQVHGDLSMDFTKSGNLYVIGLYNMETHDFSGRKFEKIDDAIQCYCYMISLFIYGLYSESDKRKLLENFTPEQ